MSENSPFFFFLFFILFLLTANIFLLDLKVFAPPPVKVAEISTIATSQPSFFPSPSPFSFCPESCLQILREATAAAGFPFPKSAETISSPPQSSPREFYIPLGTGQTQKTTWDDLIATETIIDLDHYGEVKEAYFLASLSNPTRNGQTEAQLYNVTDKHPVWGSQVVMDGPSSQTLISGKITLEKGNKLYRVQLKNSLGYPVSLDQGKIRLITQ